MIPYKQLLSQLVKGSVVSFTEYSLDRHEKKHMTLSIENSVVHQVIPANEPIGRDLLEEYYGTELSDQDYLQLSRVNCVRIVLLIEVDKNSKPIYKPLFFSQDYYESGLQEIEIINGMIIEEPIYSNYMFGNYESQPVRVPIVVEEENL